ncbi:MAG TPA: glycosyltransferase family 4 protein [Pseudomonadales bacterium]|nr:glycosyltransferase family 4 protein [Pseudomonadales bacterium]
MKFLLIASYAESILTFRGALIAALRHRGLDVHVAAPDVPAGSGVRTALEEMGVTVHDIPMRRTGMNPWSDLLLLLHLWRLMRSIRPDLVMGYTIKPVIYGSLSAWLARVPRRYALVTGLGYAFTETDETAGQRGLLRALVRNLYALALARVHLVFFQNPDDEALFRQRGILQSGVRSKVVNGSGINVADFTPVSLPANMSFLLIARLLGDKGVREYAAAARELRLSYPDVTFRLVGWIDENPDAIKQHELDTWIAEGTLEFLGKLKDVRPAIAGCTVYVLPSYREGTPRTVLEAMAMGRAIITADAPGCRETVVDGDNGFLVPVKSVNALVTSMKKLIDEPALCVRMGARSRAIAENKYDVNKVNAMMLDEMGI